MTNNDTLTELISKAQKGDKNAENELCCRSYQQILKHLYKYKCSPCNIDDIAQETIIKLITILPTLKIEQYGYNKYLKKTTWSVYIDYYRKQNREIQHIDPDFNDFRDIPDNKVKKLHEKQDLENHFKNVCSAICNFRKIQQKVIYLWAYEDMNYKDIAKKLNKTPESIHMHIVRVRNQLRELFPEHTKKRYAQ